MQGRRAETICWHACFFYVLRQRAREDTRVEHVFLESSAKEAYISCEFLAGDITPQLKLFELSTLRAVGAQKSAKKGGQAAPTRAE